MRLRQIIERAAREGLRLEVRGDRLIVKGPQVVIDRMLPQLREHKEQIIRELRHGEAAVLREAFYGHLMGPGLVYGCCRTPAGRYCPDGRRLMNAYCGAARAAGRLN